MERGVAVLAGSPIAVLVGDAVTVAVGVGIADAPGVIRGAALDTAVGAADAVAPRACARLIRADPNSNTTAGATVKHFDPCCPCIGKQ